jgi:hypothetical protein
LPKNSPISANDSLLRYFENRAKQYHYTKLSKPAGTHPELVMRLWDELGKLLPEDCHAVVYRAPVLLRPSTGVIFAFAGGTHTYAFRLPPDVRAAAIQAGATRVYHYRAYPEVHVEASTFDLADIGDEWVFGGWLKGEEEWIKSAYDFATNL